MTDPEKRKKAEALFHEAFELPPDRRAEFLGQRCGDDAELRAEVEKLLACDETALNGFLSTPGVDTDTSAAKPEEEPAPKRIGRYTIVREIGRGGMGTVYLATHGEEQFKRRVALKVLRRGVDTGDVLRRFELERQLLAALNHPNIARLLDAGETDDGRPYFAMEYVDGRPIDEYCDTEGLSIAERVRLFKKVCGAAQFAHQNLIVHRDLKPGNILVGADGEPKLLDFGIAKLLNPDLLQVTVATGPELRLMTPEYASPEQVRGERISTASDVYALGVLLYELLSGHRPYRFATRMQQEIVRVISEVEPEKPSTAITRVEDIQRRNGTTVHVTPESVSKARGGHPQKLRRVLAGDLDNIVLKAMQKLPRRRYESAQQMAEDLQRHLDGLPVAAQPDSRSYRLWKFVRRHRGGVAAAMIVFLALTVGVVGTTWQWRIAEKQRRLASDARALAERRADQFARLVDALSAEMLSGLRKVEGATAARKVLATTALQAAEDLHREGGDDPKVRRKLAKVCRLAGDVLGGIRTGSEGGVDEALESYRRANKLLGELASAAPEDAELQLDLAQSCIRVGDAIGQLGKIDDAIRSYRDGADVARTVAARDTEDQRARQLLASALDGAGDQLLSSRKTEQAAACYREAKAVREHLLDKSPGDAAVLRALSVSHDKLGKAHEDAGDLSAALVEYQTACEIRRKLNETAPTGRTKQDLAFAHRQVGDMLRQLGRSSEAMSELEASLALTRALHESDPVDSRALLDLVRVELALGSLHRDLNQPVQAIEVCTSALRHAQAAAAAVSPPAPPSHLYYVAKAHEGFAKSVRLNDLTASLPHFENAVRAYRESLQPSSEHPFIEAEFASLIAEYAAALKGLDRRDEAITRYREALSMFARLSDRGPLSSEAQKQLERATAGLAEIEGRNR